MRTFILIILLFVNESVFTESIYIGNLAKMDTPGNQSEYGSQTDMPYPNVNVDEVFNIFLHAVDRGQLKLFDKTLSRDMLKPLRVEYVYTSESPYPMVKVYSALKEPMPLPSMPEANIIGVSAVMDASGNILETAAHCDVGG
jgi:hypothetical protein